MPFLIVRSGARAGERIELTKELVIGREHADVTLEDEEISRRHLAVRPHEDGVELEDLGSTNGTFVDGARLGAVVVLSSSARVMLGETELEIQVEVPEPEVDPGATRLHAQPRPPDATIVGVPPVAAPPPPERDATIVGAAPPAPPAPRAEPPPTHAEPPTPAPPPPPRAEPPAPAPPPPPRAEPPPPAATPPAPRAEPPRAAPRPPAAVDAQPFGSFTPSAPARRGPGAATRLWGPATIVFLIIVATAVALVIYFAAR
jgi:pSer/pThr/pTyr-binding forkhead associated (FHA) protein